ncbi:hypothetical protein V8E54_012372 [Elaphomyces granulatus]
MSRMHLTSSAHESPSFYKGHEVYHGHNAEAFPHSPPRRNGITCTSWLPNGLYQVESGKTRGLLENSAAFEFGIGISSFRRKGDDVVTALLDCLCERTAPVIDMERQKGYNQGFSITSNSVSTLLENELERGPTAVVITRNWISGIVWCNAAALPYLASRIKRLDHASLGCSRRCRTITPRLAAICRGDMGSTRHASDLKVLQAKIVCPALEQEPPLILYPVSDIGCLCGHRRLLQFLWPWKFPQQEYIFS